MDLDFDALDKTMPQMNVPAAPTSGPATTQMAVRDESEVVETHKGKLLATVRCLAQTPCKRGL